ncbi:MAG: Cof-type HAD-IIB family hydrolase [Thermotogota bacterium]|nr:Cof-type HAD-IIB family hydrolase [Thermotogota bacterium]
MFELFITDLDGTLLDDDKQISSLNIEAINKLRKKNIAFSVFTGRNFYSAYKYMQVLDIKGLVALQNGALIIEMPSRKVINEIALKSSIAKKIYQLAKKNDFTFVGYTGYHESNSNCDKDMFVEKNNKKFQAFDFYFQHNKERIEILNTMDSFFEDRKKIGQLAIIGQESLLCGLLNTVTESFKSEISHVLSPIGDDCGFLEFFGPKVSKGDALSYLLKQYGTTAAKTVFIGDNYNDLPLMKKVGLPVATENAQRDIKDFCKMVVSSNNNHAIKDAIQKIFS